MDDKKIDELNEMRERYATPEEKAQKAKEERDASGMRWDGYSLGLNLLVSVLVTAAAGYYVDQFFAAGGLVLVVFVIFGFCAGLYQIWKAFDKDDSDT